MHLEDVIDRVDNASLAKDYCRYACSKGVSVSDFVQYQTRICELPSLGLALCGIRFRGMDMARPFVDVAITEKPLSAAKISPAAIFLTEQFSAFSPKHVRFYIPQGESFAVEEMPKSHVDQWVVANRLPLVNNMPMTEHHSIGNLTLRRAKDLSFYADYADAYARIIAQKPLTSEYTRLEAAEDLQAVLDDDCDGRSYIYVLNAGGRFAGLLILLRKESYGLSGYEVIEKLIAPEFQRQGLSSQLEQWVYDDMVHPSRIPCDADMIFGTIHPDNKGSLHSAMRAGRMPIGHYVFVDCSALTSNR